MEVQLDDLRLHRSHIITFEGSIIPRLNVPNFKVHFQGIKKRRADRVRPYELFELDFHPTSNTRQRLG